MSRTTSLLAYLFVAGAAAPVVAGAAFAAPVGAPAAPETRIVSYADLDLGAAAGRDRLDRRIAAAVRAVCGSVPPADLRGRAEVAACRAETFAAANASRPAGEVLVAGVGEEGRVDFR